MGLDDVSTALETAGGRYVPASEVPTRARVMKDRIFGIEEGRGR